MTRAEPARHVRTLHEGQFLRLLRVDHWEYVQRPRSGGAGFIIAVTRACELVLVEQYRYAIDRCAIELPAGIIGDEDAFAGETVEASALRELEEETGFHGSEAKVLFSGPTAAGMTSETSHFVRVRGLSRVHGGGGVDGENITTHLAALDGIDAWLGARQAEDRVVDPRVYVALYWLIREGFTVG